MANRERRGVVVMGKNGERPEREVKAGVARSRQERVRKVRRRRANGWYVSGGIVLLVLLVIGLIVFVSLQEPTPQASPADLQALTNMPSSRLATVGVGSSHSALNAVQGKLPMLLYGPSGKPELFYMGGEYCPYCAAQRWALIVALSRFGTFTHAPTAIVSAEDHVPTYSFYKSVYQSQYLDFVAVEQKDNQANPQTLQVLNSEQQHLIDVYDAPPYTPAQNAGSIPFLDFGNRYVSSGSYYDPTLLIGQSHDDVVRQIADPTSKVAQGVLGAANEITAALCSITSSQPMQVCAASPIPPMQQKLPALARSSDRTSSYAYEMVWGMIGSIVDERRRVQ